MENRNKIWLGVLAVTVLLAAALYYFLYQPDPVQSAGRGENTASCLPTGASAQAWVEGGTFTLGEFGLYREEGPPREVKVGGFWMDTHEVTNAQFSKFVEETGYLTLSERPLDPKDFPNMPAELLVPGSAVFTQPPADSAPTRAAQWWKFEKGANWRHPTGEGSTIDGMEDFPVIHIGLEDAQAYAKWAGRELPTEAEWEFAARAGADSRFPWGKELKKDGKIMANNWQGVFPLSNTNDDGYVGASPVGCFEANEYGLHDMIGNVWEWTLSPYYSGHAKEVDPASKGSDPNQPGVAVRVIKGGSYLCAPNYCMRYRPAARQAQDTGLGTNHVGFRTILRK